MARFSLSVGIILLVILALSNLASSTTEVVDEVIASVNGDIITRKEVEENIRIFKALAGQEEVGNYQKLKKIVLYQMIDNYLLQQEAEKQGIAVSNADIQKALEDIWRNTPREKLVQDLGEKGITLKGLEERIKREILRERVIKWKAKQWREEIQIKDEQVEDFFTSLKQFIKGEKRGEEDIIQFYNVYSDQLMGGEKVLIAQIIVDSKEQAERLMGKIKQGESFSTLAMKYSLGPNAREGGELGWFNLTQIQNSLRAIISSLKEGEIAGPIKINEKFYRILQVKKRQQLSLEKWEKRIKDYLFRKKMTNRLNDWLKKLREESFIQIMDRDLKEEWTN